MFNKSPEGKLVEARLLASAGAVACLAIGGFSMYTASANHLEMERSQAAHTQQGNEEAIAYKNVQNELFGSAETSLVLGLAASAVIVGTSLELRLRRSESDLKNDRPNHVS